MKMQFVVFVLLVNALLACNASGDDTHERAKRSPYNYDEEYSKFLKRNFDTVGGKHLDKTAAYKEAQQEDDEGRDYNEKSAEDAEDEEEGAGDAKATDYGVDHDWYYDNKKDYERIKALSEQQVVELEKKAGNCKYFEKDGMVCATCADPDTGDNSESCAYSSQPDDKKVAYLTRKSHNYKTAQPVEVEEPGTANDESEDQEEVAINPPPKGPKPLKQAHQVSEAEDADYGAYKLAGNNDDVADYDEPKFGHFKVEPMKSQKLVKNEKLVNDFEIIPQAKFEAKNLNQALTDFETKDWSKCNKIMKGDMTCYYCKDHKGATQEECMFISSSNPKNFKVERVETKKYDNTKPSVPVKPTKKPIYQTAATDSSYKMSPIVVPDVKEKFARLRIGRPLMPTRAAKSTAEPLVTPKTSINPNSHSDYQNANNKKAIKRMISVKKKVFDNDYYQPSESRAVHFESLVRHFE